MTIKNLEMRFIIAKLTEMKRDFSKTGCPDNGMRSKNLLGTPIGQEYLETAIKWIIDDKSRKCNRQTIKSKF